MSEVSENLQQVRSKIAGACKRAGREVNSVELIAVSKTFPDGLVRDAFLAGQVHFGESRIQEAEPKISALPGTLQWHFIGSIQRNKVRRILQNFDVIHAVDSLRLATYINGIAKELGLFPKVFLQVNIGSEDSKGGFEVQALHAEIDSLLKLDRLEIVGLMCIPPAGPDSESARPWFAALRELRDALETELELSLPGLSMGMSSDFEVAIEEGATHVRVGSSIFGNRSYRVDGELG
jgi:pyridoxal phosphate enzyme (YggS family)